MRLLVEGVDAEGRSCISELREPLDFSDIPGLPGMSIARLFASTTSPPQITPASEGRKDPDNPPPGLVSWFVVDHAPYALGERYQTPPELHHRNAVEMICILEGGGDMMMGDGPHPLSTGDCVLMQGSAHALRPGPQGCRLMAFSIGAVPAA
jgi:mannose-6-phosphate isomerase-like protein (cupin superfamily)